MYILQPQEPQDKIFDVENRIFKRIFKALNGDGPKLKVILRYINLYDERTKRSNSTSYDSDQNHVKVKGLPFFKNFLPTSYDFMLYK